MPGKRELAEHVWENLFGFVMHTRPQRDQILSRLGLTPNEAKALYSLNGVEGRTMTQLAAAWQCDPSTATWTVDRVERLGLAERRPHPVDRRVRLVFLTVMGETVRAELMRGMNQAPPELLGLTVNQLEALCLLLEELPVGLDEFPQPN
jgi:DNA-binding MarR family transcriptional regulator